MIILIRNYYFVRPEQHPGQHGHLAASLSTERQSSVVSGGSNGMEH
jgi:hypothetical protein